MRRGWIEWLRIEARVEKAIAGDGWCIRKLQRAPRLTSGKGQLNRSERGRRKAECRSQHQRGFPIAQRLADTGGAVEPFIDGKVDLERGLEVSEEIARGGSIERIGPLAALRCGDRELGNDLEVIAHERFGGGDERGYLVCWRSGGSRLRKVCVDVGDARLGNRRLTGQRARDVLGDRDRPIADR